MNNKPNFLNYIEDLMYIYKQDGNVLASEKLSEFWEKAFKAGIFEERNAWWKAQEAEYNQNVH